MPQYRIFNGTFTPRPGPALFTIFGVGVLLALGWWQLDRMVWKHDLIARIEAGLKAEPVALPGAIPDPKALDYVRVQVTGVMHHDKEFHLAARDKYGSFGYNILIPLETGSGFILLNRGFVPSKKKPPETRPEGQIQGAVTITGIARVPGKPSIFMPDNQPEKNFWLFIDFPKMAAVAGIKAFMPVVVEADAAPNPGGYPIGGQTRTDFPDNHLVYAITWFSLAVALAAIFFLSHWRREA
ncbi:MAG: SURF1 family protein [Alphaproteobacteria bacterium]